jgi:hypothetical protein
MVSLQNLTAEFCREPRKRKFDWVLVGWGMVLLLASTAGILLEDALGPLGSAGPDFILLGLAFVLMGGAELVPGRQRRLPALLRIVTIGIFLAWVVARLLLL